MAGSEPPDASKRKAGSPPEGADARAKRPGPGQPQPGEAEERQREVAEVWAAYQALHHAPADSTPPEAAFLRLLQAAQGESQGPAPPA